MQTNELQGTHPQESPYSEIFKAISKMQGTLKPALKDSSNPFFKSKYADLESCWDALRKPLSDSDLCVIQLLETIAMENYVVTLLGHSSGQYLESKFKVCAVKNDPQSIGSAITYTRRYALCAITGLTQSDDDAESAMERTNRGQFNDYKGYGIHPTQPTTEDGNTAPTHYTIPFGKYKQRSLEEVGADNLKEYVLYLEEKAKKDGKEITGAVNDFILRASEYIGSFENSKMSDFINQ